MAVLILGATGATGRLLTEILLERGHEVRVVVRSAERLPQRISENKKLTITQAALLDLSDTALAKQVRGCEAVASCLGHNLTWKGIYGHPRKLVTEATRRICQAIKAEQSNKPVKFVLMNTTGNRNRDLAESVSAGHSMVVGLLRLLLPPHADNEQAAEYLRTEVGQKGNLIQWTAVRPDNLIDQDQISPYDVFPSPTRDPIFKAGKTSRINVAHFMAELITNEEQWNHWQGQMPVIYDRDPR